MQEYKVNEEFVLLGHTLKVHATKNDSCDGCFLHRDIGCMYRYLSCSDYARKDNTNVIFKKVLEGAK